MHPPFQQIRVLKKYKELADYIVITNIVQIRFYLCFFAGYNNQVNEANIDCEGWVVTTDFNASQPRLMDTKLIRPGA